MKLLKLLLQCLINGVICAIIVPLMPILACYCHLRRKMLGLSAEQDSAGTQMIEGSLIPALVYLLAMLPAIPFLGWWAWISGVVAQAALGFGIGVYTALQRAKSPCTT